MTDDEAFIRAVVDGPGDNTPRLVYADWLDDRADPRGPYLRAECEWAKMKCGGPRSKSFAAFINRSPKLSPRCGMRMKSDGKIFT